MIKCEITTNKGTLVEISGNEIMVILECAEMLRAVKVALEKGHSKGFAKRMLDTVYRGLWMSDEELYKEIGEIKEKDPVTAAKADSLFKKYVRGGGSDSPCSVDKEEE